MPQSPRNVTDRAEAYQPHWYALRVRANHEHSVSRELQLAGIPEFLPTYKSESRWSDRTKTIDRPLLPGYVFVRVAAGHLDNVARVRGVVQILGCGTTPTPIPSEEIEVLRRLIASPELKPQPSEYAIGETVTMQTGALAGRSGVIVRTKGATVLVIKVGIVNKFWSVEISADSVTRGDDKAA